jgi:hypothetical protein
MVYANLPEDLKIVGKLGKFNRDKDRTNHLIIKPDNVFMPENKRSSRITQDIIQLATCHCCKNIVPNIKEAAACK